MVTATKRVALAILPLFLLAGCLTDPEIEDVVDAIAWEIEPAYLDPEVELRIGDGLIGVAEWICDVSDDCDDWEKILSGVDEIHLGVYDVRGDRFRDSLTMSEELRADLIYGDWKLVVSVYDRYDSTFVLAKANVFGIDEILVIASEDDQVIVLRLEGELERSLHHLVHREDGVLVAFEHEHY